MGLLGLFSLFCLLLFLGAIVHSRATLIIFSVCGLFSIILLWVGTVLVLQKVASELHPKVRNHGEGPYYGLLLVESGY